MVWGEGGFGVVLKSLGAQQVANNSWRIVLGLWDLLDASRASSITQGPPEDCYLNLRIQALPKIPLQNLYLGNLGHDLLT